jgi:autotransporter-associated beta strand protein
VCSFNNPVQLQNKSHVNVASPDGTGILTAEVRGAGQLQKTGGGLLRLNTPNVYTGGTRVSNGTLDVRNTSGSGVGTGNVTIDGTNNAARLGGTGIIGAPGDASNVTLTNGDLFPGTLTAIRAIIDPNGDGLTPGPGLLTIHGDLTFDGDSTLNMDLTGGAVGTQYDQVAASGAITLGNATLNLSLGAFSPTGSEVFTLISNTGAGAVSGEFFDLPQGDSMTLGSQTFYIDYGGGDGNDVVLSTVQPVNEDADFDDDDDIDGNDFLIWQRGQGVGTTNAQGDANDDDVVDGDDLAIWEDQFGSATANVGAVPEPSAAILMVAAAVGAAAVRRRGRAR